MNNEKDLEKFELFLAQFYGARSEATATPIADRMLALHRSKTDEGWKLETSKLTSIIYKKILEKLDTGGSRSDPGDMLVLFKIAVLPSFMTFEDREGLADELMDRIEKVKTSIGAPATQNSSSSGLIATAAVCAGAIALSAIAPKFIEQVKVQSEAVVK